MKKQIEIPVNDNYITTSRSLDPNHPDNIDILKDTEDEKTYKDLLDEVKIRFDTNPKHYQKEDYKKLLELFRYQDSGIEEGDLKTINGESLIGDGDIETIQETKTINGESLQGEGNINVSPVLSEGNAISLDNNTVSVTSHTYNSSTKSVAFGNETTATDQYSHAEGDCSEASGKASHAEGKNTIASGDYSHAEGKNTYARNSSCHAEGDNTNADGKASHAEGYYTYTSDKASHAEGYGILFNTNSTGFDWSETTGHGADLKVTIETSSGASSKSILTLIKEIYFITEISNQEIYLYSRDKKQACSVWKCYLEINNSEFDPEDPYTDTTITKGSIYFNVSDVSLLDNSATFDFLVYNYAEGQASHVEGKNTEAHGKNSHAEGLVNKTNGENSHVEGHLNYIGFNGYNAHAEGYNTRALKNQTHSEGANTQAYGENSHVEGEETCSWGKDSHAEGKSSTSPALYDVSYFDQNKEDIYSDWSSKDSDKNSYSCAWGNVSHAEGKNTIALGNNSHAEGQGTCAYGDKSHSEGCETLAKENNSHAEGDNTKTTASASHSEGSYTEACGHGSHAEGIQTKTQNISEHAEGSWNVSHTSANTSGCTQHSIGIGNNNIGGGRKNALEIMQNGDMYVYGVGGYQGTNTKVQNSSIKTLQEYIASLEARVAALENTQ